MTSFATVSVAHTVAPSYCGWRCACPDCRRDWWLFDRPSGRYMHCPFCGRALVLDAQRP